MPISINGSAGTITGVSAGGLPAGTVTAATLASGVGGKILQVLNGSTSTESSTSSTTFADNGLSLAITPSATSSKILVMVNVGVQSTANTYNAGISIKILRDSTTIHTPFLTNELYGFYYASSGNANMYDRYPLTVLDSPNTTSAITYKTQHASLSSSHTSKSQPSGSGGTSTSYITLMEIAA
tara:strand:+ start:16 stop:564 length:549 start_codon:yes stop_codon:yes gene_type:complete